MHDTRQYSTQLVLLTGFALIIALTISLTAFSLYSLVSYGANMTRSINSQELKEEYARIMRTAVRQRSLDLFAMLSSNDPIDQDEYYAALREQGSTFISALKSLQQFDLSEQERQQLEAIIQQANSSLQYTYKTIDLLYNQQAAQAQQIVMQDIVPRIKILLIKLDQFIDHQDRLYHSTLLAAAQNFESANSILLPLGSLTILLIILIAIFVYIKTNRSIVSLAEFTNKLELLEKRERLILQGLFDAVVTTDEDGYIQDFNASAERKFGYTQKEIIGRRVNLLMPDAYANLHDKFMKNYTSTGRTKVMGKGRALLGRRKDGSTFPIDVALTEFRLDEQRIFIGTIRDITRQKEHEAALYKAQEELEQQVALRTAELREANEKLEHLASYDNLTGLANRYLFTERFKQERAHARRHHAKIALLYMDLDGFKQVNDKLGHKTGDLLLKEVAVRLRRVVREEDTMARFGGDEFALIAGDIHAPADATRIAEKIIAAINQPLKLNDQLIDIGISIGISCYPSDGTEMESLLHYADNAMYEAKQKGKNQYHYSRQCDEAET